jgi:CelD/BcsL family acetyltransferase involved in cellulose biosynthesis
MLTAKVIRTTEGFARLRESWDALLLRSPGATPFLSFPWLFHWLTTWSSEATNRIIVVFDGQDRLVAGAAFCILRLRQMPWPVKALQFAGAAFTDADYLDVLCEPGQDEPAAAAIAGELARMRREWQLLELADLEEERALKLPLHQALEAHGFRSHLAPGYVCPYATLPSTFPAFLQTLGHGHRANFRRGQRDLSLLGRLEFKAHAGRSDIGGAYAELVRLHRLRFAHRRQASAFLDDRVQAFHARVVTELAERGWAKVFLLTLDDRPVAGLYGFQMGQTFWFFQAGMDPAFTKASPGAICVGRSIAEAIGAGCKTYDFLRGDEAYKRSWAPQIRRTVSLYYANGRLESTCALAAVRLRSRLKTFVRARRLAQRPD